MTQSDKNIDRLFQSEKKVNTELSKQQVKSIIGKLPSLPAPPASSNFSSFINFKSIMMISIPSIFVIALLVLPPNNENIATQSSLQTQNPNKEQSNPNSLSIKNEATLLDAKTKPEDLTSIDQLPQTKIGKNTLSQQTQNHPSLSSTSKSELQDKKQTTPANHIKHSIQNTPSTGSQFYSPQSIENNDPNISAMVARRLKRLLYKNLIKDEIIKSKSTAVEIELYPSKIIINGEELSPDQFKKYRDLTAEVGTGENRKIEMNRDNIKVGDFSEDGFSGIGVGKFHEGMIELNSNQMLELTELPTLPSLPSAPSTPSDPASPNSPSMPLDPINHIEKIQQQDNIDSIKDKEVQAERKSLNQFIDVLYKEKARGTKRSWFTGNKLKYKDLKKLHADLYDFLLTDGLIKNEYSFVVLELRPNGVLLNGQSIKKPLSDQYEELIDIYDINRKDYRMIKMSRHTISVGDYQHGSFTGTFYDLK